MHTERKLNKRHVAGTIRVGHLMAIGLAACWAVAIGETSAAPARSDTAYLFSYFTGNGEDGLHLAWSRDGLKWEALNGGRSYLKPEVGESKLMRDPCLLLGTDGTFHMVWTTSWTGKTIGYASSKDLLHWSVQQAIPVMAHEPNALNCWAPEVVWDEARQHFLIFWATTIPGRFPKTDGQGDDKYNHRMYCTTTKEFQAFTPTRLFYDPGFNVIDATLLPAQGRFHLILKDETRQPPKKHLRIAVGDSPEGPFTEAGPPFTRDWVEGPSALKVGEDYLVYFDAYRDRRYEALRSRDLKTWEDITSQVTFPKAARHGTAIAVPQSIVDKLLSAGGSPPDASAGQLDRGLVALVTGDDSVYLGWRLLASDPPDVAFDVYRSAAASGGRQKLTRTPIQDSCNFVDTTAAGKRWQYVVHPVGAKSKLAESAPVQAEPVEGSTAFRRLKLQGNYVFDKIGIADLDGDGQLDFVIKQPNQLTDPGVWKKSEDTFKLEAYKSDGTFLWRTDLGWNIEQGVWWSPMIVYDFDGDGKAEVAVKTAPMDQNHRDAEGKVTTGPEWCSVLDGLTGREIARVDWPARGDIADWGDAKNNRASRHLMGLAYLDGQHASLLVMRGTYTKMLVDAYDLVDRKLRPRWHWNGDDETPPVRGQGMHGMHAADVDGDGRDEIVLGAAVLDDNGKILWNLGMGHPDAVYVSDILPERPGLEIIYGFESKQSSNGFCLVEAKTGKLIWGCPHLTTHIHSQGMFGDFDPENPGPEFYDGEKFGPERWTYSARDGKLLARDDRGSLSPYAIYWADGPVRMVGVRGRIGPYRGVPLHSYEGRVVAAGDVLGDWREELVTAVPGELRIYTTTIPATSRRVCLLQDRAYRTDVALAAMGYLYPPQVTGTLLPVFLKTTP